MGKKKDKLLAKQQQQQQQQQQPIPWQQIDVDPVGFLVAPEDPAAFFSKHWEQQPCLFKATPGRVALFQGLCSFPSVLNWLRQREKKAGPLEFGVDVNAARYKDGSRETPNGEVADAKTLQELHSEQGCTLQLHQPQRFFDPCWRLLAALERQLGCLVGSNAYLTPSGSQGLAPHHDDVELWVVQTSGTKRWRLYSPTNGFQLPNQPSGDLDPASLGQPIMEVELSVGDCLYLPRGTVHQAEAAAGSDSSHLTISTYQRCSYADLATHLLQVGLSVQEDEPRCLPLAARRSPAPGTLLQHSLHHVLAKDSPAVSTTPDAVSGLAGALRAIADKLEGSQGPGMLTAAVHSFAIDFLMNRLPPHPKQLPGKGRAPTLDDKIWCRVAGWGHLLPFEMTGMMMDDDDDAAGFEDGCMKLCTCLSNSREEHMITVPDDDSDDSDDESSGEGSSEEEETGSEHGSHEAKAAGSSGSDGEPDEAAAQDKQAAQTNGHQGIEGTGSHECDDSNKHSKGGKKKAAAAAAVKKAPHAHECDADECVAHQCDDTCGHNHSLSSGAGAGAERSNPVAAMPGLVFEPKVAKAVVTFMAADSPDKAIPVRELALASDSAKLQFAFALWAEDLAATVVAGQQQKQQEGGSKKEVKKEASKATGKRAAAAGAAVEAEAEGEQVATSSGKERPSKKAKA